MTNLLRSFSIRGLPLSTAAFLLVFFFASLYPFVHNSLLYCVNLAAGLAGLPIPPKLNLALLGWKDGVLILGLLVCFAARKWRYGFLALAGAGLCYLTDGLNGVKVLFEPVGILLALVLYRDALLNWARPLPPRYLQAFTIVVLVMLTVGFADLIYRELAQINQDNWTQYPHLLANNVYRCAKYLITTGDSATSLDCLHGSMNFYKIDIVAGEYVFLSSIFLPVGDSVVQSGMFFYFLALYLFVRNESGRRLSLPQFALILLVTYGTFRTFNRVNSFYAVTLSVFVSLLSLLAERERSRRWIWALLGATLFGLYLWHSHYLFLSFFNKDIPSNLGHQQSLAALLANARRPSIFTGWLSPEVIRWVTYALTASFLALPALWMAKVRNWGWFWAYLFFIALYVRASYRIDMTIQFVLQGYEGSSESDFFKGLAKFGAVGVLSYSTILSYLAWKLCSLAREGLRRLRRPGALIPVAIAFWVGSQFLSYQFMAPYFISGYAVYGAFIGIWFLMTEKALTPAS